MKIDWTKIEYGGCESIDDVPEGAIIDSIDDITCVGMCENCSSPILINQSYGYDEEGTYLCDTCIRETGLDQ